MYTLEICGRPIAIINDHKAEAEDWFEGEVFKSDLLSLDDENDEPLWDEKSPLFIRPALGEEVEIFERAFSTALAEGDADKDDREGYLVFLTPVRDPTDDEFDDED